MTAPGSPASSTRPATPLRAVLVMLATCALCACALRGPADAAKPSVAQSTAPAVAGLGAKRAWPESAMASRAFDGGWMFVERDGLAPRAWILSADGGQALEFFSGARTDLASLQRDDDGRVRGFVTADGRAHVADPGMRAYDAGDSSANGGARYFGSGGYFIDFFQDALRAVDTDGGCDLELQPVRILHRPDASRPGSGKARDRILMFREAPFAQCPSGRWVSWPRAALDLGDGSLLLTMSSKVVRVRMSDLAPLGSAPEFKVMDAESIKAVVEDINVRGGIADPNEYLSRKLAAGG
jgi:hypothetical protein